MNAPGSTPTKAPPSGVAAMTAALSLLLGGSAIGSPEEQERAVAVNREVESVAKQVALWPGYDPLTIPLAIYTGSGTYLFRHPGPPEGFVPLEPGSKTFAYEGRHPAVTSNSSADIGGTPTATLLADGARAELPPTQQAATALHEAFHVYQRARHPSWSGNEGDLFLYPVDDAGQLGLRRLESRALRLALAAPEPDAVACWAGLAMSYRGERFARLDSAFTTYERRTELNEGLATYVQLRAAGAETVTVPEEEFAASAVRDRTYAIGPALAFLLDRLQPAWKASLESDDTQNLDSLLASAAHRAEFASGQCSFSSAEIARIEARAAQDVDALVQTRRDRRKAFDGRPGWRLIVECPDGQPLWPQGFDPLNVERVDGGILHTRFLKLGNEFGSVQVIDEAGVDLESLTEGAGPHPLFNGVRKVTVAGLPQPDVVRGEGRVAIRTPGVTLTFEGADAEIVDAEIHVRLRLLPGDG